MPVKKEREYRTVAAPLSVAAAAKRIDTEYYVEGYATTFDKPYLLYEFEDGTKFYERIDAHALDGADMSDVIMQYDHEGRVFARESAVIEQDINNSIAACKSDLQLAGVVNINENDALIIRAVTLFVKAEFNYQNAADRYRQSYEALKMSLCLAGDYNTKEG